MTDLVKACLEKIMATLIPAKTLLEKHIIVMKTYISYPRLVELVVGFATSPEFKKTDNRSSRCGCFSEGVSPGEQCLLHAKSNLLNLDHPFFFLTFGIKLLTLWQTFDH